MASSAVDGPVCSPRPGAAMGPSSARTGLVPQPRGRSDAVVGRTPVGATADGPPRRRTGDELQHGASAGRGGHRPQSVGLAFLLAFLFGPYASRQVEVKAF